MLWNNSTNGKNLRFFRSRCGLYLTDRSHDISNIFLWHLVARQSSLTSVLTLYHMSPLMKIMWWKSLSLLLPFVKSVIIFIPISINVTNIKSCPVSSCYCCYLCSFVIYTAGWYPQNTTRHPAAISIIVTGRYFSLVTIYNNVLTVRLRSLTGNICCSYLMTFAVVISLHCWYNCGLPS